MVIYKDVIVSRLIDIIIWTTTLILVTSYVLPQLGLTPTYGAFFASGLIFSAGYWHIWSIASNFVADINGPKTINHNLTLPVPNSLVLIKQIISSAIQSGLPTLIILPIGKLLLLKRFPLTNFSFFKFSIIFILSNLFVGAFSMFIVSVVKDMNHIGKIGVRFMFPLWFLGGSQFSWLTLHTFAPKFSYATLANPLIYALEGSRTAILGQKGYIPFWTCIGMLFLFSILFGWLGIIKMKKRLDYV